MKQAKFNWRYKVWAFQVSIRIVQGNQVLHLVGDGAERLGIRGTDLKSSIQDIMDEVAPIKKSPPYGVEGQFIQM